MSRVERGSEKLCGAWAGPFAGTSPTEYVDCNFHQVPDLSTRTARMILDPKAATKVDEHDGDEEVEDVSKEGQPSGPCASTAAHAIVAHPRSAESKAAKRKRKRGKAQQAAEAGVPVEASEPPPAKPAKQCESSGPPRACRTRLNPYCAADPPRVGLTKIYTNGLFPEGEISEYKNE